MDEHNINHLEAVVSQEIQKVIERNSGIEMAMKHNTELSKSMAMQVVFDGNE
jgi:hypothetical protein